MEKGDCFCELNYGFFFLLTPTFIPIIKQMQRYIFSTNIASTFTLSILQGNTPSMWLRFKLLWFESVKYSLYLYRYLSSELPFLLCINST